MNRLRIGISILLLLALLVGVFITPVRTTLIRLSILLLILIPTVWALVSLWRKRHLGKGLLAIWVILLMWIGGTLKLTPIDEKTFIKHLKSFEGTEYVWGGETSFGIDCSGLIRQSILRTYLERGRLGSAFRVWFTDCPAKNLGSHYHEVFEKKGEAFSIRILEEPSLKSGSIVVTKDGLHVLAYVGGRKWIQASPEEMKVITRNAEEDDPWFSRPVKVFGLISKVSSQP